MKTFFSILILLSTFGFISCDTANDIYFNGYLTITNEQSLATWVVENYKYTLCDEFEIEPDRSIILHDVKSINKALKSAGNRDGLVIENVNASEEKKLNFIVRNNLTEYDLISEWKAQLQGNQWKFISRKDTCWSPDRREK